MLKNPKKHFGIMPTGNFIAGAILFMGFLLIPLATTGVKLFTGASIDSFEAFASGARLIIMFLFTAIFYRAAKEDINIYAANKRVRYIRRSLVPFLNEKYGVKINSKEDHVLARLAAGGHIPATRNGRLVDDLHFVGWNKIEEAAKTGIQDDSLGNSIYLMTDEEDGSMRELVPVGAKDGDPLVVLRVPQEVASLSETETGIQNMFFDILSSLPPSETSIKCISPSNPEFEGVNADLRVSVGMDDSVSYSNTELKSMIETTLFNVRLNESGLVVCIINTPDGKTYISGRMVDTDRYTDVAGERLRRMSQAEESETMIFLDDLKTIH